MVKQSIQYGYESNALKVQMHFKKGNRDWWVVLAVIGNVSELAMTLHRDNVGNIL